MSRLLRRAVVPLSVSVLATAVLLALRFGVDTTRYFKADVSAVGAYVTAFGALYGILAAFIIYVVWSQFNGTESAIASESGDLSDLCRYVAYLKDSAATSGFKSAIESYISAVTDDEWQRMAQGTASLQAHEAFERIYREVRAVKFDDERDEAVWSILIRKFEDISDSRVQRLQLATRRIPVVLSLLLYAVSIGLVAGFFMLSIENDFLAVVTTFLTTAIVVMVIDTVLDIDNPFGGEWAITAAPFLAVRETLGEVDRATAGHR